MNSIPETASLLVPLVTLARYAELSGLTPDCVRGMADRGYLPIKHLGRRRLINMVELYQECADAPAPARSSARTGAGASGRHAPHSFPVVNRD